MKDEKGVLHIPMLLCLLGVTLASLGLLAVMHRWRTLTNLQLRIDECVGQTALHLKSEMNFLENSNERIRALRISIAAASLIPGARAPLTVALNVEAAIRDARLTAWKIKQVEWLIRKGCSGAGDLAYPLPDLGWRHDPPDFLGPTPLVRADPRESDKLTVRISHPPRYAGAEVIPNGRQWSAQWAGKKLGSDPR